MWRLSYHNAPSALGGDLFVFIIFYRPALEEQGIKNFIHVKCNVLDTLKEYQKALGIKEL